MSIFVENHSVVSAQDAWYTFKAAAISSTTSPGANWTVVTSSTGSGGVYAQSGDVITSAASLNNLAWFVLRGKGTLDSGTVYYRELCFQFNAAGAVRITYSPRMGFVAGTPSTTQVPSADDGTLVYGGGTDAAPTFTALLPSGGVWMQARISEVDDAFWVLTYAVGGALPNCLFYLDVMPLSYTVGGALIDQDPCVIYCRTGLDSATKTDLASVLRGPLGYLSLDVPASTLFCRLAGTYRACLDTVEDPQATLPGAVTTPPSIYFTSTIYQQETLRYERSTWLSGTSQPNNDGNANTVGEKGEGTYLRWAGTNFAVPQLIGLINPSSGDGSANVVLGAGQLLFPWECGTVPSL